MNSGRFLDDLLASLAAQTFRDFEIIVVDDGSTEPATVDKLDSLDPTIHVVRQANGRLPNARNHGFREAHGEFVLPLDSDDMLEPAFLSETIRVLADAPADVGFAFTHVRLTGALDGLLVRHCNRFDQLFLNFLGYCVLVRKSAWEAVGGYDETMLDGMEDWDFNIRLLSAGYRGIGIAKPLMVYRVHADGMLMQHTVKMHGTIWRYIRTKNRDLYRPGALLAALARRKRSGRINLMMAVVLLGSTKLLPEPWFNKTFYWLFARKWRRRIARARY
jgi:glycosyltransferase involved in cell wall biosynthesis